MDARTNPLAFVAWFGCLCGIYIFGQGFYLLRHKRRAGGIPLSTIQGSATGPVQVHGVAAGEPTLTAAASGKSCFYYHATIWRQNSAHDDLWERVAEETRRKPFLLGDDTGQLLVDPEGAEIDLLRDTHDEYGKTLLATRTDIPAALEDFLERYQVNTEATIRVEEYIIAPGTEMFIAGTKILNPGAQEAPARKAERTPLKSPVAMLKTAAQIIHLTPDTRPVPATEMTMQSRVAAALSLARTQTQEQKPAPLNVPSVKVAFAEPEAKREPEPSASPKKSEHAPPPFMVRQSQGDSRFRISHRAPSASAPTSGKSGAALLIIGPLVTAASSYVLLLTFR